MDLSSEFAALTTFRKLCNHGKDIYDVIKEFILFILVDEAHTLVDAVTIRNDVNHEFNLEVPLSVIKRTLSRLINNHIIKKDSKEGYLSCISTELKTEIEEKIEEYREEKKLHIEIKENLIEYVRRKVPHRNYPEDLIFKVFRSFILGSDDLPIGEPKLVQIVGTFILKQNKDNPRFSTSWDQVKSSIIIKEGFLYKNDILSQKIKNLVIFLDMEILFDGEGYNGTVYQEMFTTFIKYIETLRNKGCKIELKYFEETDKEIELYFKKALDIFDSRSSMRPETTAMIDIVSGCKNRAEIIEKKEKFFHSLETSSISIVNTHTYKQEKYKFPLRRNLNENSHQMESQDYSLLPIEYIKTLKRGKIDKKLTETNYIFMTRTNRILEISKSEKNSKEEIPLAVNTDYLINNFWLISGDGFGGKEGFTSTVSYVQRILSNEKRREIVIEYENLKSEEGSRDIALINKKIAALRTIGNKPEQIDESSFDYEIDEEITELLQSREKLSEVRSKHKKIEQSLEAQVEETSRIAKEKTQIQEENTSLKNIILQQKKNLGKEIDNLYSEKDSIDSQAETRVSKMMKIIKICSLFFILTCDIFIGYIIIKNWNVLESWLNILTLLIPPTLLYVIFAFSLKKLSLTEISSRIESILLHRQIKRISIRRNFDLKEIENKKNELERISFE